MKPILCMLNFHRWPTRWTKRKGALVRVCKRCGKRETQWATPDPDDGPRQKNLGEDMMKAIDRETQEKTT